MRNEDGCNVKKKHSQVVWSRLYTLLLVIVCLSGCGGGSSDSPVNKAPESIAIQPANNKLAIGKTQQFKLVSSYTGDISSSAVWSSSSTSVATITPSGMVSAVAAGQTIISAVKGGISYTTALTVPVTGTFDNISGVHPSATGIWDGTYTIYDAIEATEIGTYKFKLNLNQSGTSVTGTSSLRYDTPARKSDGTFITGNLNGSVMEFVFTYIDPRTSYEMVNIGTALISGTTMTGEVLENHKNGWNCSYRFTLTKQ